MQQSERVSSTSGNDGIENNDEDSDIDLDSWPGDSTSPNDSKSWGKSFCKAGLQNH